MRAMLLVLAGLTICALLAACQPVRSEPLPAVTLDRPADQAHARWAGNNVAIDIYSPSGIGQALIEWPGALGAEALALRLHLAGLEGLQVTDGAQQAALSVNNAPPYTVRSEGDSQGITVERTDGVFYVTLPPQWLQTGRLSVQWVDFYR